MGSLEQIQRSVALMNNDLKKKKKVPITKRVGLIMSAPRMNHYLSKKKSTRMRRISKTASVYMAGLIEFLVSDIAQLASYKAKEDKRTRITMKDVQSAIESDSALKNLCSNYGIYNMSAPPKVNRMVEDAKIKANKHRVLYTARK